MEYGEGQGGENDKNIGSGMPDLADHGRIRKVLRK